MSTAADLRRTRGKRPADTLAARLVLIRHEQGVSQREASIATGVPYGTWQGMELGRATRNLDQWVPRIAARYEYDRDWLMWGDSDTDDGGDSMGTRRYTHNHAA